MSRSAGFILVALSALLLQACGNGDAPAPAEDVVSLPPAPPQVAKSGPLHFVNVTRAAGITFRVKAGTKSKLWIPETIGQGVMLFDYDADGDLDLYFANGGELREKTGRVHRNGLWRNDGGWRFTDVTEGSGLECPEWSCGVYHVDLDADGWDDVYVTQLGRNRFFRNLEGSGRFEDVTDEVGGDSKGYSTSAAFFDADADGDLDLYVCDYVIFDPASPPNDGLPCEWKNLSVCCGPRGLPAARDVFYENTDGKLVEATEKFGFTLDAARSENGGAYSLGVVTGDYDDDGDPDVYVAVDSKPNLLFENLGGGRFREVAQEWQTALNADAVEQAGMGVAAADLDEDGRTDLFVTNFSHDTNTLYVNSGTSDNIYFEDATSRAGLGGEASYPYLSWGTGIHDFDCDGRQDIFVASGHVYPQAEGVVDLGTSYAQPNQLYMGREGDLQFEDRASTAGPALAGVKKVSRGTAFGDIDRDGKVDVVVTNLDDWPDLIRNESDVAGHWIGLQLRTGDARNPCAIGARVRLRLADGRTVRREVHGGGGYMGANDLALHVGLARGSDLREIEIRWPDGKLETVPGPALDGWYRIDAGAGEARPVSAAD